MLSSAKFLYRAEPPPANAKPGRIYRLSDLELASRLSFFLWSSIPDEELLTLAEQGKLSDAEDARAAGPAHAGRSALEDADDQFRVRVAEGSRHGGARARPVRLSRRSTRRCAPRSAARWRCSSTACSSEDRSVVDLLSANYTFVNERLAPHYGMPNVRGDQFRRVTLTDPNRFGLLGKASVLMVTAYPNRTSPVLRGAYILENMLGTPPSPPPPNVEAFKENKEGEKPKTIREIMETHRANPTCNACHGVMDPLGFSLENFDTIGDVPRRWTASRARRSTPAASWWTGRP